MQNTRLNSLTSGAIATLQNLITNPWRRLSLIIIGLLAGFFLASAIPSATGQATIWDVTAAAVVLLACEAVSRFIYGSRRLLRGEMAMQRTFTLDVLNALKIGTTYGLFLEAFKLNS
ncbi:MAG: DUF565 domain-containing protein [Spirulinaceae cyanobacterium SM2_1_0]|nr:DUF565 domain-containing protein [Spirulinaceae cyanobacterium SM2_1_0]